ATFVQGCFEATGEILAYMSSMDTADDIERIRQALTPRDGLVAHGASYGTAYGAAYLERYGDRVQALVLDAVVDHSIAIVTELGRQQLAVQDAFDRMAEWCGADPTCALHGEDLGRAFDAAVTTVPAVRSVVPQLLAGGRDPQIGWPAIAQIIARARDGDPAALAALQGTTDLGGAAEDPWLRAGKEG